MRLGYFTMPPRPAHRDPLKTLQEDGEAIIVADKLGLHDAFVGEHLTDRCENVTNSDRILELREQVGEFGELVYAGMDWVDPILAKRSMELMATEVMPRVNRTIDESIRRRKLAERV